ncbi:hypothetical protein BJ875DRAFT_488760 [Amylocarpus encephaloides]|uniref:Uncharacterized protein n=1 Tax=Amylocarpus encephaloides TaxID=45428 RepID=A0A9P7YAG3_9HELO|nr:hypothetical protein BJ875DRAFT_488760 [Amylocarpus encephaloides]
MPKLAAKRKWQGDARTTKSKPRRLSVSRKDDSDSQHSEDESDDHLFVREHSDAPRHAKKSKTRKSEPVRHRVDEYEEDEGRMESQQFLALVQFESKKKKMAAKASASFLEKFASDLKDDEKELKQVLQNSSATSTKQDSDFEGGFQDAYLLSRPKQNKEPKDSKSKQFSSLFKWSKNLTENARQILRTFEGLSKLTSDNETSRLLENTWEEDDEKMIQILDVGHKLAIEKYECLIGGNKAYSVKPTLLPVAKEFYGEGAESTHVGWGRIADRQERGIRKIVKSFQPSKDR